MFGLVRTLLVDMGVPTSCAKRLTRALMGSRSSVCMTFVWRVRQCRDRLELCSCPRCLSEVSRQLSPRSLVLAVEASHASFEDKRAATNIVLAKTSARGSWAK